MINGHVIYRMFVLLIMCVMVIDQIVKYRLVFNVGILIDTCNNNNIPRMTENTLLF